jgi:ATP-dependent helicase/nuclease subunit A
MAASKLALSDEQQAGSEPEHHIWLSASAGTGKTSVLSARVLRLLMRGVRPDAILCLTFTKAGATEMAERVHATLARWVRADPASLYRDLEALGETVGPGARDKARRLFAEVLEARSGGLRIMTIHSFCQMLLANFPLEAGLAPGFRPIEGREAAALERRVLAELIVTAEREQPQLIADFRTLSIRMGEDAVLGWLRQTAGALAVLEELAPGIEAMVRRGLGVLIDERQSDIAAACDEAAIDRTGLLLLAAMQAGWGTATGEKNANRIAEWLLGNAEERAAELDSLRLAWATKAGPLQKNGPKDLGYLPLAEAMDRWANDLIQRRERIRLADEMSSALRAALAFARAYADAKRIWGLVDFDDLIGRASALLTDSGSGDWIRYKLDQATDHVLVDEAQDTNADQWAIIEALAEEYWAGAGAKDGVLRTLFAVGDFKQAIFGFQGTNPRHYERAGINFELKAVRADDVLHRLSLTQSFRSTPPVLQVVDAVLDTLGTEALGLTEPFEPHVSHDMQGQGQVIVLPPIAPGVAPGVAPSDEPNDEDESEKDGARETERVLATRIARQVKTWISDGPAPALKAGDIMILCRTRGTLAALIVARLIEEGVPVAGVDRLRLQAPLAVQDMLAVMRFALQPRDDLLLAALLVSPLIGWTQEALYAIAQPRGQKPLWDAVPDGDTRDTLRSLLAMADLTTPYRFMETILSGPIRGRAKLIARLGEEARDPLDELLAIALQFEREGIASLQSFVEAFDRGDAEIKRDADAAGDAVRVMTVHGAKGLQAPLVILADACKNPDNTLEKSLEWQLDGLSQALPMFRPRKAERQLCETLASAFDESEARAREEHWRLLYVAMTRAERMLVVAGALSTRDKGEVPQASWHAAISAAMEALGATTHDRPGWGEALIWGKDDLRGVAVADTQMIAAADAPRPAWMDAPAPAEARPPRPLAPSSLGQDDEAQPPPSAAMARAAERGRVLHALFERLPGLPPLERRMAGRAWLGVSEDAEALLDAALSVIEHPEFAPLFVPDALAEAPIAGVVEGVVIAGTVDRLIVTPDRVTIIDYKTGRRVPHALDAIPRVHVRQMAAYAAVLMQIYPERAIEAVLLYTEGPTLHRLPQDLLDAMKPDYQGAQAKLALSL